jgi:hypothetical protein
MSASKHVAVPLIARIRARGGTHKLAVGVQVPRAALTARGPVNGVFKVQGRRHVVRGGGRRDDTRLVAGGVGGGEERGEEELGEVVVACAICVISTDAKNTELGRTYYVGADLHVVALRCEEVQRAGHDATETARSEQSLTAIEAARTHC